MTQRGRHLLAAALGALLVGLLLARPEPWNGQGLAYVDVYPAQRAFQEACGAVGERIAARGGYAWADQVADRLAGASLDEVVAFCGEVREVDDDALIEAVRVRWGVAPPAADPPDRPR